MIRTKEPRKLFLLDGAGALLTAIMLGVVLPKFETYFGIPRSALYILAVIPLFYVAFDFYSIKSHNSKIKNNLVVIAFLNILYCLISIGMSYIHRDTVTVLGWVYIIVEIVIIAILVFVELRTARQVI